MKVSLSWLKDYVPIEMEVNRLADALTMAGLEVEVVTDRYEYLDSVVVGRITEIAPHPDADKLTLCDVDIGDDTISVVCGASNASLGMLAPAALPGTVFPDGFVLEKSVIRGETSEGMLCSEAELGLGTDEDGLMVLSPNLSPGDKIAKALGLSDYVLEIGLTPNRSDCLSIIGVAREIAAIQKTRVKYPDFSAESGQQSPDRRKADANRQHISDFSSVIIEAPDHCPRYAARLLDKIKIAPSPFWIQDRLMSVGLRPINNIVDITNFVLMETGQPLHAFDFDNLAQNRIVVRTAKDGEKFTTLDDKERTLNSDMLMICDGEKPVAIGGVMGGLNSEIEESTTRVLLESACFNAVSVRKTSKKLGLNTEASHRFERGVDPCGTVNAANRAVKLMAEFGEGRLFDGVIDEHPGKQDIKPISLSVEETNRVLGISLDIDKTGELLKSIEFAVEKNGNDSLVVVPPSFRVDITRPVDLMEEVARLSGYDNIPTTIPLMPAEARRCLEELDLRERLKGLLTGLGLTETINYSFIHSLSCDRLCIGPDDEKRNTVDVLNPLTEDQAIMRTSLIPGLLDTMHRNIAQVVRNLRIFEIGKVFISKGRDSLPDEPEFLVGLWTGSRFDASWHYKETECDFFDIKGVVEGLLAGLNISNVKFTRMPDDLCNYTRPGHTARITASDMTEIGLVGELHPRVLKNYDLKQTAFIFEINLEVLGTLVSDLKQSKPIPKYPAAYRDITIIVNKSIESESILENVRNLNQELVEDLFLFDVYEGGAIPEGNKSISFRVTYRSHKETLEDDMVNSIHQDIADRLLKEFDASLPV
ncbi:MAG: phenylalanine--tRNA ligase subunit beta [Desulfobacteraceae bacterium]|nr:phenylalanine--tRNA ligase subunit beta [Desulfobacteraceae bacterium]